MAGAQSFDVKPVRSAPNGIDYAEVAKYQTDTAELKRMVINAGQELSRSQELLRHMQAAALAAPRATPDLFTHLDALVAEFKQLGIRLNGDPVRNRLNETSAPSISDRANNAANTWGTTQTATATQRSDFDIAKKDFAAFSGDLEATLAELAQLEAELTAAGAPSWR